MSTLIRRLAGLPTSNRFAFEAEIGSGGMGTVYRALDRRTNEIVAIKVLNFKLSDKPTLHLRLQREFRAAHALEHPNIVRAIAFENDGNTSFVVYEFVAGSNLGDRLDKHGRFDEPDALRIITQVAQALDYAHARRVIHRDVKPDNLMQLPDGRVKLTDFGLAKDCSDSDDLDLTRHASGLGTPHFMAPEQFANAKGAGPLCDVYSLGATLYNLITGKLPFDAKTPLAILAKKELGKLVPARDIVPTVSEHVDAAIRAAVDTDPKRRPQSCLEFFKRLTSRQKTKLHPTTTPMPLRIHPAMDENRREWVRFPIAIGTLGVVDSNVHSDSVGEELWPLVVQDISSGGIKILLARRFEPGTELFIELSDAQAKSPRRFAVRVMRVKCERAGHWTHGCSFVEPLGESKLKVLLKLS